jgi:hypothetical protein
LEGSLLSFWDGGEVKNRVLSHEGLQGPPEGLGFLNPRTKDEKRFPPFFMEAGSNKGLGGPPESLHQEAADSGVHCFQEI